MSFRVRIYRTESSGRPCAARNVRKQLLSEITSLQTVLRLSVRHQRLKTLVAAESGRRSGLRRPLFAVQSRKGFAPPVDSTLGTRAMMIALPVRSLTNRSSLPKKAAKSRGTPPTINTHGSPNGSRRSVDVVCAAVSLMPTCQGEKSNLPAAPRPIK